MEYVLQGKEQSDTPQIYTAQILRALHRPPCRYKDRQYDTMEQVQQVLALHDDGVGRPSTCTDSYTTTGWIHYTLSLLASSDGLHTTRYTPPQNMRALHTTSTYIMRQLDRPSTPTANTTNTSTIPCTTSTEVETLRRGCREKEDYTVRRTMHYMYIEEITTVEQ